jgi:hypothetical protein
MYRVADLVAIRLSRAFFETRLGIEVGVYVVLARKRRCSALT